MDQDQVRCVGIYPFCGPLSRRGLTRLSQHATHVGSTASPILAASAFSRLGQCASSPDNRAYRYAELAVSSLVVAQTIANRLLIAPTHGGMARLSRPG